MPRMFAEPSLRLFLLRTALPITLAAVAVVAFVAAVLVWSSRHADQVAIERQEKLVALVVSQLRAGVAHDQESATVWDDAVEAVRDPNATEWIDSNLGTWMNTYFGHDGAYVLDAQDRAIYAFSDGAMAEPQAYGRVARSAAPLVAELRRVLRRSDRSGVSDRVLSPGISDIAVVEGHPAVVSVKPIVSDTGRIEQTPGEEFLHVAVRNLDDSFIEELKQEYLFEGLRFAWSPQVSAGETSFALHSAAGAVIGYFVWTPYRPGTAVLSVMLPTLGALLVLVSLALAALVLHLRKRSLKLQASEAEVRHLALHDTLTGLPNRTLFNKRLNDLLAEPDAHQHLTAVLYLDLDRFKQVNDTLGHPTGDELIRQFGARLQKLLRSNDTVARIGGDEFTIILPRVTRLEFVEALCGRIIEAIAQPFSIDGNHISVGVSIGVSVAPIDGTNRTELARKADIALYHAKSAGRGRFAIFGKDMDAIIQARRSIESDLRAALEQGGQIEVFYQALHSAQTRQVTGLEALARWRHPERGWVSPAEFIPIAEDSGLIEKLGEDVLRSVCQTAAAWPVGKVAVNVSAIELRNPHYAVKVANILLSTGMNPRRLELEVTESALTGENGTAVANVNALRALGVAIAIDDFGTGFSSLNRLQQLTVDRVKIDRSFIRNVSEIGSDAAIVQAIVNLAKATGLKTTAEGVETTAQRDYLQSIGCDDIQGFLHSKPVSKEEMAKLLGEGAARLKA